MSKEKETDAATVLSQMSQLVGMPFDLPASLSPTDHANMLDEDAIGATCTLQPSSLESDLLFSIPDDHTFTTHRGIHNSSYIPFDDAEHTYAANNFIESCVVATKLDKYKQGKSASYMKQDKKTKSLSCSICGKQFKKSQHFSVHMRFHAGEKPFSCIDCSKAFTTKSDLKRHQKVHFKKDNQYECNSCYKTFRDQATLTRHLKIHKPSHLHVCKYCEKEFSRMDSFKSHINTHENETFNCKLCSAVFSYKSSYNRHMMSHDIVVSCGLCKKEFTRKDTLKAHVKLVHKVEDVSGTVVQKNECVKSLQKSRGSRRTSSNAVPILLSMAANKVLKKSTEQ